MLREVAHFVRHAPAVLRLKAKLPQEQLYQTLMERMDAAGLGDQRSQLVADLRGDVVEIGSGTGIMFPHYHRDARVSAIEPDAAFRELSLAKATPNISVTDGTGEALPFPDGSFDTAVLALVLCSVSSPRSVLTEVRRVLRPRGQVRLIEHVRSPRRAAGWLMDRIDPLWLKINAQGCHLNRDPLPALEDAGFEVTSVEPFQVYSAGIPAFPMRRITAAAR